MSFSVKERQLALTSLAGDPPDVLIIGAGIVGVSLAAHASRLGLRVAVIEKEDIAAGASGNSTGLAHAGLRYLAQGRVGYVFKEGRERHLLQERAPQWVRPFDFILPVYKGDPYAFWMVRLGTAIYDLLGWIDAWKTKKPLVKRHQVLSADEVRAKIPGIRSDDLQGGIEYYVDARLQDSRFTLGYAQQAAAQGARIVTHCRVVSVVTAGTEKPKVALEDLLTGRLIETSPLLVVNATGGWIDEVRQTAGLSGAVVQKSKGVHLIVDHIADKPLIMSSAAKGKVFFVVPIDSERSLVGTTDTAVQGPVDEVRAEGKDVQELLQQLLYYFPYLKQGPNLLEAIEVYKQVHVRDVYWGLRPLVKQQGSTLEASREHRLVKDFPRFWSVPGVKLTAGRAVGFEVAVEAWDTLRPRIPVPEVTWDSLPGGDLWDIDQYTRDAQRRFKLGPQSDHLLRYLVSMYGSRYMEVLQWAQREPDYHDPVATGEPWILAEVAYAAHEEMVVTLNDFLWRRTKWAHYCDLPPEALDRIGAVLKRYLGWTDAELAKQMNDYHTERRTHRLE